MSFGKFQLRREASPSLQLVPIDFLTALLDLLLDVDFGSIGFLLLMVIF
jgi:hypothetical protein